MRIRKFKDSDAAELARLHRSTIRTINSIHYSQEQINVWSERVSAQKFRESAKKNIRFVAVEKGKIIGFADYRGDELMGLYVHRDHIGKGVGKQLLEKVERHAYKKGVRIMHCTSTITAHNFYEKNGYQTIKKAKHQMGDQKLIVFQMKKKLKRVP